MFPKNFINHFQSFDISLDLSFYSQYKTLKIKIFRWTIITLVVKYSSGWRYLENEKNSKVSDFQYFKNLKEKRKNFKILRNYYKFNDIEKTFLN